MQDIATTITQASRLCLTDVKHPLACKSFNHGSLFSVCSMDNQSIDHGLPYYHLRFSLINAIRLSDIPALSATLGCPPVSI